jgi:hypothetical protein
MVPMTEGRIPDGSQDDGWRVDRGGGNSGRVESGASVEDIAAQLGSVLPAHGRLTGLTRAMAADAGLAATAGLGLLLALEAVDAGRGWSFPIVLVFVAAADRA